MHPRKILITGASSGIGKNAAISLCDEGWHIIGCGRDRKRLQDAAESATGDFEIVTCDFNSLGSIPDFVAEVYDRHGPIDAFLNCAGQHRFMPLQATDHDDLLSLMTINTLAPIAVLRELLKLRALNDGGSVIFIGSAAARKGSAGTAIYSASKAAVAGFARSIAIELASRRITVNCVEPGIVDTPLTESILARLPNHSKEALSAQHALGFGRTSDVTALCSFILSDAARWLTGAEIPIDGGFSAA